MKRSASLGLGALVLMAGCQDLNDPLGPQAPQLSPAAGGSLVVTTAEDTDDGACTPGHCTLREAINAANVAGGAYVISFRNKVGDVIALESALPVLTADITLDGPGAHALEINGELVSPPFGRQGPIVSVADGATVEVRGLSLRGGRSFDFGGAVHNLGALTLSDMIVTDSEAGLAGGGISNAGELTVLRSVIRANTSYEGGGIWNAGVLRLIQSTIESNQAISTQLAGGGGILNRGSATVLQSTIAGNTSALTGGGIYNSQFGGVLLVQRSTISGNRAGTGELAAGGGGINNVGQLELVSTTITRNERVSSFAEVNGAGLLNRSGTVLIRNTIIAGNRNELVGLDDDCANITLFNAVLVSAGHNLSASGDCELTHPADIAVLPAQVFSVVLSDVLADNGGPTLTHALIERGHAVDAGYCPGELMDQRGLARPFDDTRMPNALDGCDIGAFEWQPASTGSKGGGRNPNR
jgi:CSLREA domain-containing protein